ncbi:MAG: hypothetical protein Q9184_005537 [Pyrenodesmia sp. 2 TL-2023]
MQPGRLFPAHGTFFPPAPGSGGSISTEHAPDRIKTVGVHVIVNVPKGIPCPSGLSRGDNHCVLTCHHVVSPVHSEELWDKTDREGIPASPKHDPQTHQKVLYPSRGLLGQTYGRNKATLEALNNDPVPTLNQPSDLLQLRQAEISNLQGQMKECVQLGLDKDYALGKVVASSGREVDSDGFIQDVAVVSITPKLASINRVPASTGGGWGIHVGRPINYVGEPRWNEAVLKEGAVTGATEGKVQHLVQVTVESVCPVNQTLTHRTTGKTWSVTAAGSCVFSSRGDSAAMVANKWGGFVGQIHSGLDNGGFDVMSFMTPAVKVMETARAILPGCQVRLSTETPALSSKMRLEQVYRRMFEGLRR